jgi:hypothetical protein
MKITLDDIIMKYIRLKLKNYNVYVKYDIIWVFYGQEWVFNLTEGLLISYSNKFFDELKTIFGIDNDKLNNIIYIYSMKLLRFNGPIEIQGENFPWTATLNGINRRIENGTLSIQSIEDYEGGFN